MPSKYIPRQTVKPTTHILLAERDDGRPPETIYCTSKTTAIRTRQRLRKQGWTWFAIIDCSTL